MCEVKSCAWRGMTRGVLVEQTTGLGFDEVTSLWGTVSVPSSVCPAGPEGAPVPSAALTAPGSHPERGGMG